MAIFRNSSPGALTLQQSYARERKRVAEQRRLAQEAREPAAQGRGGDTEIAHVTRGELVVPRALQNPEVLAVLRRAAAAHNIPPEALSIGNARNRINPKTGQPQFSYGGPEYDPDRNQASGRQVADLYINRFPDAAEHFGHVGIGVNTDQTQGFYPIKRSPSVAMPDGVPGVVRQDDLGESHDTLRIPTSPEQDAAVQDYIDKRKSDPGNYQLLNRQCTDFVRGALGAGGQSVPSDSTPNLWDDKVPNMFFPLLRNRYGR